MPDIHIEELESKTLSILNSKSKAIGVTDVIAAAMECVEALPSLKGPEKSQQVFKMLTDERFLNMLPEDVRAGLVTMLRADLVQQVIDIVCEAASGKLDLKKTAKCCSTLFKRFKKK